MDVEQAVRQRADQWVIYPPRAAEPSVRLSSADVDAVARTILADAQ